MIYRSNMHANPYVYVASEVAVSFGACIVEAILASVYVWAHQQAGHTRASDQIKLNH